MKVRYLVHSIVFLLLTGLTLLSCNNDEIDDLQKRVNELETQLQARDTIILGDLQITNQESMNSMAGRGVTNILGTLYISNCVDLTPLKGLRYVASLIIDIPTGLSSLEGLNDLKGTSYLNLTFNESSNIDISALDGLETLDNISLEGNLPSISWFNEITHLGSLNIYAYTPSLSIAGFENLIFADYIYISNWQGDLEIQGFENLTSATNLSLNANYLAVSGFNNIQTLSYLDLSGESLNFSGLNGLVSLDYLHFEGSTVTISGLSSLRSLNNISLYGGNFTISGLENLEVLEFMDVYVENSITGLNNLKRVNQHLFLGVPSYGDFLTGLTQAGRMNISTSFSNPSSSSSDIKTFADFGFSSLQSIRGLTLDVASLESMDGFDFSNSTLEVFGINSGPNFTDLSALSTYSGSILYLNLNNTKLTSLNGLENITQVNEYLSISGNSQLEDFCAIKDIIDLVPVSQRYIQGNLVNPASSEDITGCE